MVEEMIIMMRVCVYWDDDLWVGYDFVMLKSGTFYIFIFEYYVQNIYRSNKYKNKKKCVYIYTLKI